jgi:glutamine amidotransferase
MIVIVNYGIGNLDSVLRAFERCGADVAVSSNPEDLEKAHGIVLPGVGSFVPAMAKLKSTGMDAALTERALHGGTPLLGICLGFQMLTRHSEEGEAEGLGWIGGETRRFDFTGAERPMPVPHIGWNDLAARRESPLFRDIHPDACFYFAHSFCVSCDDEDAVVARSNYGYDFVSAAQKGHIFGTQFHPEKSHAVGLQLIRNFVEMTRHA